MTSVPQQLGSTGSAEDLIRALDLRPQLEGGFYRETWRHKTNASVRGAGTAIYLLLRRDVVNRWNRVDAAEIWHC